MIYTLKDPETNQYYVGIASNLVNTTDWTDDLNLAKVGSLETMTEIKDGLGYGSRLEVTEISIKGIVTEETGD